MRINKLLLIALIYIALGALILILGFITGIHVISHIGIIVMVSGIALYIIHNYKYN